MFNKTSQPLSDIGKFYKQIEDFKKKLCGILLQLKKNNEIIEIEKYYDKLLLLKTANPRGGIELLYKHGICVYAEQILLRDDQFFIGEVRQLENGQKIIPDCDVNQRDLLFIGQIRGIWEHLTENVKKNIWDYVQVICLLAEKIVSGNVLSLKKEDLKQSNRLL